MEQQKFGSFIAALRKEKGWTQRELADCLNVTDKAVSKWERGLGFPDIKSIEPLAEALGVSVLEIMRAEHIEEEQIDMVSADEAVSSVIDTALYQRKIERRNMIILLSAALLLTMGILLIDAMEWIGFVMVCLPVLFTVIGVVLLVISWMRRKKMQGYATTLVFGILGLLIPIVLWVLLALAFVLGGPVPN